MGDFRELRAWQAAHRLTITVYRVTAPFPVAERFGLTSQIRRAASSIGANIAEGCGRGSDPDARRCFRIAFGSACELQNHAMLARDLGLLDAQSFDDVEALAEPVRQMVSGLVASLGARRRN